jgi:carboxy-cis,cis-muconate cyclase
MMSIDSSGTLTAIIANITYEVSAGIHGVAISADTKFLYSADDMGGAVWAHSGNISSGEVAQIQYLTAPPEANPGTW